MASGANQGIVNTKPRMTITDTKGKQFGIGDVISARVETKSQMLVVTKPQGQVLCYPLMHIMAFNCINVNVKYV